MARLLRLNREELGTTGMNGARFLELLPIWQRRFRVRLHAYVSSGGSKGVGRAAQFRGDRAGGGATQKRSLDRDSGPELALYLGRELGAMTLMELAKAVDAASPNDGECGGATIWPAAETKRNPCAKGCTRDQAVAAVSSPKPECLMHRFDPTERQ